jgi:sulfur carrier protein ThiS
MPDIRLRLFGFGPRASGWDTDTSVVPQDTTVAEVWKSLRSSAQDGELLARIDERHVFFLVNGKLIHGAQLQEAVLRDDDTVTFMVMAIGGQS